MLACLGWVGCICDAIECCVGYTRVALDCCVGYEARTQYARVLREYARVLRDYARNINARWLRTQRGTGNGSSGARERIYIVPRIPIDVQPACVHQQSAGNLTVHARASGGQLRCGACADLCLHDYTDVSRMCTVRRPAPIAQAAPSVQRNDALLHSRLAA